MKCLYANGCSFTWHLPLAESEMWPNILAHELGIPEVINEAQGASGNQRIFRSVNNFLINTEIPVTDILAVIQITYPFRFELPLETEFTGWQNYLPYYNFQNTGFLEDDINYEYYLSKMKVWAQHECLDTLHYYQQVSAISNLLRSKGVRHYFITNCEPDPNMFEPTAGGVKGPARAKIQFDHSQINWLYDDPWRSNMYYHIKEFLDIHDQADFTISSDDIHIKPEIHQRLCKFYAEQIKLKEQL